MDVFIDIDSSKYSPDLTAEQKMFPSLSLSQKYDAVLNVLHSESGKAPTFDDLNKVLFTRKKQVHWGEVMDILYTMIGDGYLYGHFVNQKKQQIFLISFNGKLLKETGGYENKLTREKEKDGLSSRQLNASITNVNWSKGNIIVALLLSATTLVFVISNWNINDQKFRQESNKQKTDSLDKLKREQSESELKEELRQISLSLKDTLKVKGKIEK